MKRLVSGLFVAALLIPSSWSAVKATAGASDLAALLEAAFDGRATVAQLVRETGAACQCAPPAQAVPAPRAARAIGRGPAALDTPTPAATPTPTPAPFLPSIQVGSASGAPGEQVTFAVSLNTAGLALAGTQNDLAFDSFDTPIAAGPTGSPDCAVNPSISKEATQFAFQPSGCSGTACTAIRALVISLGNVDPIPDGVLYTCNVSIAAAAAPGDHPLAISNVGLASPAGDAVPGVGTDGTIVVSGTPMPPVNDNFAAAKDVSALPYADLARNADATLESGEPMPSCAQGAPFDKTVWYAFMPMADASITASVDTRFPQVIAVYTGPSLGSLQEVGCRAYSGPLAFVAQAGMTYYFQIGTMDGVGGSFAFYLDVTPPPQASFFYFPGDPSVFDTVQFYDTSYDPANVGIASEAWDFGDGTTAEFCCPNHRYAAEGDYTVALTVTTYDGRTASTAQTVQVRTHDVAITKFMTPQAAKAGQTRQIAVGISSKRYPERVIVELYKSMPGGYDPYELVGVLTQDVPTRPGNRTTDFAFNYTFTNADKSIGKVTFKAVARLENARDALPADNEAISAPTKVN